MSNYLPVFIFLAILLLIDWYLFSGVRTATAAIPSERGRMVLHAAYWLVNLTLIGVMATALLTFSRGQGPRPLIIFALNFFVVLFVPKLVLLFVLGIEDVLRVMQGLISRIYGYFTDPAIAAAEGFLPSRRRFISQLGLGLAGLTFGSFVYGLTRGKYNFRVHRHTLFFPDLPEAFEGFRITQLSDIHAGSFGDPGEVARGVELANAQQSDLVVFTGDMVNNEAVELEPWIDLFGRLEAPHGKFSVFGNHDYGDYRMWPSLADKSANLEQLKKHQATMGFRLLLDEHVEIERNGQKIALIGVQNWGHGFAQYGNLEKALSQVPADAFKVLLSHDPTHWEDQVKDHPTHVHLTLSGHTHGAQMGVEIPGFRFSPSQLRYPRWAGPYFEAGRHLYINRGFGYLGFHGRVGIAPEVTVLELRRG
jgi:predicted MPP superfamily phosphohydrolase